MDILKNAAQNLKGIGFGSAVPGLRDQIFNAVENVTASDEDQKARIRSVLEEQDAQKEKQRMAMRQGRAKPGVPTMKKGGKVSSASKRGDGCAIKGKTRGRMV